jgi:hypothetical protein
MFTSEPPEDSLYNDKYEKSENLDSSGKFGLAESAV